MAFRWPHQYVVAGRGAFPRDMLRYDEADFATLADELRAAQETGRRRIKIIGEVEPHVKRWESFGWTVAHIEPLARATARRKVKSMLAASVEATKPQGGA